MFAIISDGSHQYRVEKGAVVWFEAKNGKQPGDKVEFPVLLLADGERVDVGKPHVQGARVTGEVVEQARGEKIRVFKYTKSNYRKLQGHRQGYTAVKITDILAG